MSVQLRMFTQVDDFLDEPFPFVIARVSLAGENKLHRLPQITHHPNEVFVLVKNQRRTFVRRKPPRETDGQRIRVKQVIERDEIARIGSMFLILQSATRELDQLPAQPITQRPKFLVADERRILNLGPKLRLGQFLRPIRTGIRLAKFSTPEFPHRPLRPASQVDAVGHVADRHLVHRAIGIKPPPHFAAHCPVQLAHTIGRPCRFEREDGHAKFLVFVIGIHSPKREQLLGIDLELVVKMTGRIIHQPLTEPVVSGRHRRVRGKQTLPLNLC